MIHLDYRDARPIYTQIVEGFRAQITGGVLAAGDKLPSVRELAAELTINPNTIQKAYKMLEDEGLMESRSGAKSYMVFDEAAVLKVRQQLLETDATAIIGSLKQMGLNKEEALKLIETYWE